jgi:hypothetical protein
MTLIRSHMTTKSILVVTAIALLMNIPLSNLVMAGEAITVPAENAFDFSNFPGVDLAEFKNNSNTENAIDRQNDILDQSVLGEVELKGFTQGQEPLVIARQSPPITPAELFPEASLVTFDGFGAIASFDRADIQEDEIDSFFFSVLKQGDTPNLAREVTFDFDESDYNSFTNRINITTPRLTGLDSNTTYYFTVGVNLSNGTTVVGRENYTMTSRPPLRSEGVVHQAVHVDANEARIQVGLQPRTGDNLFTVDIQNVAIWYRHAYPSDSELQYVSVDNFERSPLSASNFSIHRATLSDLDTETAYVFYVEVELRNGETVRSTPEGFYTYTSSNRYLASSSALEKALGVDTDLEI